MGRQAECERLNLLIGAVRVGKSQSLVVRGEPGVGKSALLLHLMDNAPGCRVVSALGIQSEMELPYAALHQLCMPLLGLLDAVPQPQRDALGTAFGVHAGPPPDRFLVGVAVLSLLSVAAEEQPLLCVVDDAQWLDRVSAQVLAFVARRLDAESVACLFGARTAGAADELSGLPQLQVGALNEGEARELLSTVIRGPLDEQVRDRIIAEAHGNPLALLELPRSLAHDELAGGFGLLTAQALPGRLEDTFRRRLAPLPPDTRLLLLLASAEPLGDPVLVRRAALRLGIKSAASATAPAADLIDLGLRVRFRHPLVRSAVYRAATPEERMRVHGALAEVTDAATDPDRRAWHHAHAAAEPNEETAGELEHSAGRAQARGGRAAAAAFMRRAAELTPEPGRRAERALAAAWASEEAGAPEAASELLTAATAGPLGPLERARASLLRAQIAFTSNHGNLVPPLLLQAARQLEPLDVPLAREAYLQALSSAMFAGRLTQGAALLDVAAAAKDAPPPPGVPTLADLLLDAVALFTGGDARAAAPAMQRALKASLDGGIPVEEEIRWLWLAFGNAVAQWDDTATRRLSEHHVRLARDTGALSVLPLALNSRIMVHLFEGELDEAETLSQEVDVITTATQIQVTNYGALALAAWRGREPEAAELIHVSRAQAMKRGEGVGLTVIQWVSAILYNGLGRYADARAAAQQASADPPANGAARQWAPTELVEAAARCGDQDLAHQALEAVTETTQASTTDWGPGIEARSRALLTKGHQAEELYREAIDRLSRTRLRSEAARAHLLYGEWLRRERRRLDAREQLRTAHEQFTAMGAEAFAERAARELRASGETAHRQTIATGNHLTPREAQIVRLASDGLTNSEVGSQLFISARTVEYHLSKVFAKTGVTSRTGLGVLLSNS
ncbi:helix-turn-helix transcriptional regulator [Myceligenerans indicum]|uniref:helix-turn-helix transcriptional regulator n=1 Tax=Myceligenerans indicum TaxID=2593663 RepID=UPI0027DE1DBF|nr:AAA family ATPase [Myceligenerans indicum]